MASLLTPVGNNGSIDPRESTLRAKKEELLCVYAREDEDVAFPSFISLSLSLLRWSMKQSVFVWPLGHDRRHTVTYSLSC